MKTVCLDTHTVIWAATRPTKLGRSAARVLRDVQAGKAAALVPSVVVVELSLLREGGRKSIGVAQLKAMIVAQPALSILSFDFSQACEFALLDALEDPFDRMIVAAARCAEVALVTADSRIEASRLVEVIWD